MNAVADPMQIEGIPPYVRCWSAAGIPGFVNNVFDRWQRDYGRLPSRFALVLCPQVEVNAMGGLPSRVKQLTDPRLRMQHFTGCSKPYVVLMHFEDQAEGWSEEIQKMLPWSESYRVEMTSGTTRLQFIDAVEETGEDD